MTTTAGSEPFVFTPNSAPSTAGQERGDDTDRLVKETRREIAEIVREVAVAVRSDRTAEEFFSLLVDRIARAMAAEGVIVWRVTDELVAVRRLGRTTDQSIPTESDATHRRLLSEVASVGQPVVVPATPGAADPDMPANPMQVPVALVPIELETSFDGPSYLLEVFLESNCGVATQRGYLRFVAQMADLAGEFLRSDQLRTLRRKQNLATAVDEAVIALHRIDDQGVLEAAIVDRAAEIFGFDRVGLVDQNRRLLAVSYVDSIDKRSAAARQLQDASEVPVDEDGSRWLDSPSATDNQKSADLVTRAIATDPLNPNRRLVCMQIAEVQPIPSDYRAELNRYMLHADMAIEKVTASRSRLGSHFLASILPGRTAADRKTRRAITSLGLGLVVLVAAMFPVPLVVSSPATIRPAQVQTITAPREAVVDRIHVHHGQTVTAGELLITLQDPDLEEQLTALVGRRAVLLQQKSHWTDALVDTATHQLERLQQVQGESRLVSEEIRSIDEQIAVLKRAKNTLEIRARQAGMIDAWQIDQRLQSRPLQRGDWLLQVIGVDSPWTVEANVAQSRINHLHRAGKNEELFVLVSLESSPSQTYRAELDRMGPAVVGDAVNPSSTAVLLRLGNQASTAIASKQIASDQSGAPARAMFHCGTAPAALVLFQDVIRSVHATCALYFGGQQREQI